MQNEFQATGDERLIRVSSDVLHLGERFGIRGNTGDFEDFQGLAINMLSPYLLFGLIRGHVMMEPFEILLVEDYAPDAQYLLRLLRKHLATERIQLVWNGAQALDFVFQRGIHRRSTSDGLPFVVLLDIRLPKVDGWEVLRRIKADPRSSHIPVVLVSGSLFDEEREKARELGAAACLLKPVHFEELQDVLAHAGLTCSMATVGAA
jgi:two-component system response regulator